MTSAERIRILRERAGLSQNDLAVKLDLYCTWKANLP